MFADTAVFSDDIMFSAKIMGGRADYAYDRMRSAISDINAEVSLSADSDLKRFNDASADESVEVGKICYELAVLAKSYYKLTDGAFNPALLPLSLLWHVDASSIAEYSPDITGEYSYPELPQPQTVAETLCYCDPDLVTAEERGGRYYLTKSDGRVQLDFGGIAKGYAVDVCKAILDEYDVPSALIDISGNAYFYGDYFDKGKPSEWRVGVVAPRPRAGETISRGYVCAFSTGGGVSAVTSGDYMRYYKYGRSEPVYVDHIIGVDGVPTGVEYDGGWKNTDDHVISATVIGTSSALCDALSTAVAVLGIEDGARLLQKVGCKGLIFTEKRFTIIGDVGLYKPDEYDGYKAYEYVDPSAFLSVGA